jgi:predicted transposase/invertase (TIGR01784 family)
MSKDRILVSLEWAATHLVQNHANFEVVEGFLSELLRHDIKITDVLKRGPDPDDKYRIDVIAENEFKEVILIEMLFTSDPLYLTYMLLGACKAVVNRMPIGDKYKQIKKIYAISIVYSDIGYGEDYVYCSKLLFEGTKQHDPLELELKAFNKTEPGDLCPDYYVLRITQFKNIIRDKLDEWVYFLKNTRIEDSFTAKGLPQAREILDYNKLSEEEKVEYESMREARNCDCCQTDNTLKTSNAKDVAEDEEDDLIDGEVKGLINAVVNCNNNGLSTEQIQEVTGLTKEKVLEILRSNSEK